ncbi:MAG: glycosyltransferase [Lachnospiraceae bacterium]|nr:glycosyltransferase [Lachnospiraceae bacterium]
MEPEVKVSVIVPIYNGEKYLSQTLECIVNQTLKEIEILCVDDGSTDKTVSIVKKFRDKDARIQLIQKEKSNAGAARNAGMKHAHGKYYLFWDADDLFETEAIEKMYLQAEKDEADICVCNADQYDMVTEQYLAKPQYLREKYLPEHRPCSGREIGKYILYFTSLVPWNKMIRKEYLQQHDISFQNIERANDQFFSCMSLILAERICIVDEVLVHYRVGQQENLTTNFAKTPLCSLYAMLEVKDRLQKEELWENTEIRCAFDNKVLNLILFSLSIQNTTDGYKELYSALKQWGFEKLGVFLHEEDYYFDSLEYKNLSYLLEYDYDMYLLTKNREYRDTIARKNASLRQKNDAIKEWKEQAKAFEKELKDIKKKKWYQKITHFIDWYHAHIKKEKA